MSATDTPADASASVLNASVTDEIERRLFGIRAALGPTSRVSVILQLTQYGDGKPSVLLTPIDQRWCEPKHFTASCIGAALTLAEAWAATYEPIRIDAIIRKLALDVIDLKDQHGNVTVAMLRGRRHSQGDIDAHKDAACVRAGEMSAGAPFEVVS